MPGLSMAEPHASAAPIHFYEFDAGSFQSARDHVQRGAPRLGSSLKLPHGHNAHACRVGELLLVPIEKRASGAALCWRDHEPSIPRHVE